MLECVWSLLLGVVRLMICSAQPTTVHRGWAWSKKPLGSTYGPGVGDLLCYFSKTRDCFGLVCECLAELWYFPVLPRSSLQRQLKAG